MNMFHRKPDGSPGAITVMVTLILIPTIFFTTFMVDLARLKLYGNQAVMAADDYGAGVISIYDNVLKDLYGLFAVAQEVSPESTKVKDAIDSINNYIKSSFNPAQNAINWNHLAVDENKSALSRLGVDFDSSGASMPYAGAKVELNWSPIDDANLAKSEVLATQIGDFMRFRIVQSFFNSDNPILKAAENIRGTEPTADVMDKKNDFNEILNKLFEKTQEFYNAIKEFVGYPAYLGDVNNARGQTEKVMKQVVDSEDFKNYSAYMDHKQEIDAAVKKRSNLKKDETLTAQEQEYCDIYDRAPKESELRKDFDNAIKLYKNAADVGTVNFSNFSKKVTNIGNIYSELRSAYVEVEQKRKELDVSLAQDGVDKDVKAGIEDELQKYDRFFNEDETFSIQNYENIYNTIKGNESFNNSAKATYDKNIQNFETIKESYLTSSNAGSYKPSGYGDDIKASGYSDFANKSQNPKTYPLYERLRETFDTDHSALEDAAESKKNFAEKLQKDNEIKDEDDRDDSLRNIPKDFGMGDDGYGLKDLAIVKLIKTAKSLFSGDFFSLKKLNDLLLKFYVVEYDFSMFSHRTTNVVKKGLIEQAVDYAADKTGIDTETINAGLSELGVNAGGGDGEGGEGGKGGDDSKATSLTGYELCREINYLYKAEIEYIFGGHRDSNDNYKDVRNKILLYRAIVDFIATYTIKEVNAPIEAIQDALMFFPPLALAVGFAIRLAVMAVEMALDWKELKDGGEIPLYKTKIEDLMAYQDLTELLTDIDGKAPSKGSSQKGGAKGTPKVNYEQLLKILLYIMTPEWDVFSRTGDLISLNVNTVKQQIPSDGKLEKLVFTREKAYTAVNSTCSVHLDFVAIPDSMAFAFLEDNAYKTLTQANENYYSFSVTRGY